MSRAQQGVAHYLALAGVLLFHAAPLLAQRQWRPADRAVVGSFLRITAVAAASDQVYATSSSALLIWRPRLEQWEGPFTPPVPGMLDRVFAGLIDPLDNSLWLARTDGWVHFRSVDQQWLLGKSEARVRGIAFDLDRPELGLFLDTAIGWMLAARGHANPAPIDPPKRLYAPISPEQVPNLGLESPTSRVVAAARGFGGRGWYLGTYGDGLLYVPDGASRPEPLEYGLPGDSVRSIAPGPGGVWTLTQTDSVRLTFVTADLHEFRPFRPHRAWMLSFGRVSGLVGQGPLLWVLSDSGLVRVDTEDSTLERFGPADGLPDLRILSAGWGSGRFAVGTARGVAVTRLGDTLRFNVVASGFQDSALAVTVSGDTVWVGTRNGLRLAIPARDGLLTPAHWPDDPRFHRPVLGLSWQGDTLVANTDHQVLWRNPKNGAWRAGPDLSGEMGGLSATAAGESGTFVSGDRGLGLVRPGGGAVRFLSVPGDLPAPPHDLAFTEDYLWAASDAGLVRWRLGGTRP